jgi:hypothetical protein
MGRAPKSSNTLVETNKRKLQKRKLQKRNNKKETTNNKIIKRNNKKEETIKKNLEINTASELRIIKNNLRENNKLLSRISGFIDVLQPFINGSKNKKRIQQ